MAIKDIERFKRKFNIGDIVIIPEEIGTLANGRKGTQVAEVVSLSRNFFNVKYDKGYQQSIQYKDAGKVNKIA